MKYRIIPESNVQLVSCFKECKLDIANNLIDIVAEETNNFSVLDWISKISEDGEIITLLNLSEEDEKILCMLRISEIFLMGHEFNLSTRIHEIQLKFSEMERVKNPPKTH